MGCSTLTLLIHIASSVSFVFGTETTMSNRRELVKFKFDTLPPGAVRPTGWLKDQLQLSADGLAGHLFEFYRYVARSTWLGGDWEYSELNEASPYWFNYIVPLAWSLDDAGLKSQAKAYLDYVLDHQAEDGWLGPETTRQARGLWARSLLLFGLTQYAEADPPERDRIVDSMHKFLKLTHSMLRSNFTGLIQDKNQGDHFDPFGFGLSRTHELPISLMWLYENHPRDAGDMILETVELMFDGGRKGGRDWTEFFVEGVFPKGGTGTFKTNGFTHGVNLAQGLRYPTVLYRLTGNDSLVQQTKMAVDMTAKYQGSVSGTIIADEHLGALSPQRGSELCMAVESIFSYAFLYRFHGVNDYADKAELAAFNAFPVAMSQDWWSHQYVTQTNQILSGNLTKNPFFNVVSYANTYGLEPNFPCCTVNHPQAYAKYVASSYATINESSIAHILLGPTSVETRIKVRIPGWTTPEANIEMNGGRSKRVTPDDSGLHHETILPGTTSLTLKLPMEVRITIRNSSASIYNGPLLYAFDIPYTETHHQPLNWTDRKPLADEEVHPKSHDYVLEPTELWQYAIDLDSIVVKTSTSTVKNLPNPIFTEDAPPVFLTVDAWKIAWPVDNDTAAWPPIDPVVDKDKKEKIKLVPFGSAKLHIAQFPVAKPQ
ncbi:six-hairpin glycosidase [Fusarium phyllophilum]|uniref:Six-hairpin glycosidase n=1 Tax=Fusarium phyllophilum TaxID=47803 RepID=A0A8H5NJ78_9HYPO|nr:six-hairpin glycosidase [Fusarium phyllophilum]